MDQAKQKRLEEKGWKVSSTQDFLGLSNSEMAYIDMRIRLGRELREERKRQGFTQQSLADQLGSSQSRVAKIEAGDSSVSLDLTIRSLLALGFSSQAIGRTIAGN